MLYVLLITPVPLSPDMLARVSELTGMVLRIDPVDGTFHLDMTSPTRQIRIEPLGSELSDWNDEPGKLQTLKALGPLTQVYAVHYKIADRLRRTLTALANLTEYILDDDHDLFVTSQEFVALSADNPMGDKWWIGGIHNTRS
ncbi:MAG: hypothetical protein WA957_09645 [Alteraurantiacibacter sp.]